MLNMSSSELNRADDHTLSGKSFKRVLAQIPFFNDTDPQQLAVPTFSLEKTINISPQSRHAAGTWFSNFACNIRQYALLYLCMIRTPLFVSFLGMP